jgi:hypothetical protein
MPSVPTSQSADGDPGSVGGIPGGPDTDVEMSDRRKEKSKHIPSGTETASDSAGGAQNAGPSQPRPREVGSLL